MASAAGGRLRPAALPPARLSLVLLGEPLHQRLEILADRGRVDAARAGEFLEGVLPGLRGTQTQHLGEAPARLLTGVVRTLVQRSPVAGGRAQRLVELELQNEREEIARVRGVGRYVVLGARIEVGLGARHWGRDALVAPAQLPPAAVVALGRDFTREHPPAPLVDQPTERQEGDLLQRHFHLLVDERLVAG